MIGISKRLSSRSASRVHRISRRSAATQARTNVSLIVVAAIMAGDFGVPLPPPAWMHGQAIAFEASAAGAVSATPRCGCAKAGTVDCCCARRGTAQGARSCCARAAQAPAPRQIAARAETSDAESQTPSFNACACGEGARPGLLLSHQPRLATPECFGGASPAWAKLEIGELAIRERVRLAPEPPRPKSLCG